jgi:hypothetical protein
MSEPATVEEYAERYHASWRVSGYGIEGVTNHFPCPFCAAPDWLVVRVIDFEQTTDPIECSECGRSARHVFDRGDGGVLMSVVQTDGPDPPEWVPIPREQ